MEKQSAEDFFKERFIGIEGETWFPAIVALAEGYAKYCSQFDFGKVMTNGAGEFRIENHLEHIYGMMKDCGRVAIVCGGDVSPASIAISLESAREQFPEMFSALCEVPKPMPLTLKFPEIPEIEYEKPERRKGHERSYKFHR